MSEDLSYKDLKTLITWGFQRQLTWAALFAAFLIGLTELYLNVKEIFPDLSIYILLFGGFTISLSKVIQYLLFIWTWEERLKELRDSNARAVYAEIEKTTRGSYKLFIQIHNGRASFNWCGLILAGVFYVLLFGVLLYPNLRDLLNWLWLIPAAIYGIIVCVYLIRLSTQ